MSPLYTLAPDATGWSLTTDHVQPQGVQVRGASRDEALDRMFGIIERIAPCMVEVRDQGGRLLDQFDFLDQAEPGVEAW